VAIPKYVQTARDAKVKACSANMANINAQWEAKFVSEEAYGTLAILIGDTDYFPDGAPTCPFGTAYTDTDLDNRVDTHSH
ncbi:hypothetical protein ACFL2K_04565, partial [Candidatus Margulisiibacteriota bacterium]